MYNLTTKHILTLFTLCCLLFSCQLLNAQCHIDDWTALKALYEEPVEEFNWSANWNYTFKNEEPPLDCTLNNLSQDKLDINLNENGRVNTISIKSQLFISRIPEELEKLSELTHLILASLGLYGHIPNELSNLAKLVELNLGGNNLSGKIPIELGNLTNLVELNLCGSNLSGNIPIELGNLTNLVELNLCGSNLSGNIPPELGNLKNLVSLRLQFSNLNGNIPPELGNLNNLTNLNLSYNNLSGEIPVTFGNLNSLNYFFLENNQIIGNIPPELGNLSNLKYLYFHKNQISGSIPPSLGNLKELSRLSLYSNKLSGEIPPELVNLTKLRYLDLANNQLIGEIPDEFSNFNSLYDFLVDNNKLTGKIPSMKLNFSQFGFSNNYFICNDFENVDISEIINNNDDYPYFFYVSFNRTPQKYNHNAVKSFLVNSSEEPITLSAPFSIQENTTYQWYKGRTKIEGATDSILHLNNVELEDLGDYTLHVTDVPCDFSNNDITYISEPISVRRTDLKGCTDEYGCNYNPSAMIDDGSCEYFWCHALTNPIKIKTTNEQILSENKITFDLVIDSLGQDYSADGLTFTLDTRGNYQIKSIDVINPALSITEVDVSQLYSNTLSIDRTESELLASKTPLLRVTAFIVVEDIPTDEATCSHFHISGGTELSSGHFISFDNVYIDIPFSSCSPYGGYGAEGENWLPLVLTISAQNCKTNTNSLVEIKILEEGQSPFSYILKDENDTVILEDTNSENLFTIEGLNAGNYKLTVADANGKTTSLKTCIPLIANLNGNEPCNSNCVDYVTVPNGFITGNHQAKKEIEIKGYVGKNETVEFSICD